MQALLQFLGVWGVWIAFSAGTILAFFWVLSIDGEASDRRAAASMIGVMLWPIVWIQLWLNGKREHLAAQRETSSICSTATAQVDARELSAVRFRTVREAKEFLVGSIVKEAEDTGTPLTDVERKMLYFTERGWTLPGMKEISAEFDRGYDQDEYEKKIGSIVSRILARLQREDPQGQLTWDEAVEKLSEGDHYLLVLIDASRPTQKGAKHNLKLLVAALVFFGIAILDGWFRDWLWKH